MKKNSNKYLTGSSALRLLFEESNVAISNIKDSQAFLLEDEQIRFDLLPVNSESTKTRIGKEIDNRFKLIGSVEIIDFYVSCSNQDRLIIVFYGMCKINPLISDFMFEVVLDKWQNISLSIDKSDVLHFLFKKMTVHPEIEKLTEYNTNKISARIIRMLTDLGMIVSNQLKKTECSNEVLRLIAQNGDAWFLDILLLQEYEKQEILGQ